MKLYRLTFIALLALFFACNSDTIEPIGDDGQDSQQDDSNDDGDDGVDDGILNETVTVSVVNAFENLAFTQPLDLQSPNDGTDRIFVAEKTGRIRVFENDPNVTSADTYLDLSGNLSTTSEQGLIGFAFHPDYASNGYVYVCYNPSTGVSNISRFTVSQSNANAVDPGSEVLIIQISQPDTNHNGGQLAFGPDGYLYISSGDGGGAGDTDNNSQTRSNLLGNILRIDVDNTENGLNYAIPLSNPFVGENGVRGEIYAYGLRNPWRMSFDSESGSLWAADVGQGAREEIDVIVSGGNYGWKLFEGTSCFSGDCNDSGLTPPIYEYGHDNGDRSVTGGTVYRGDEISSLKGKYIYGDYVSGRIWALETDGSTNQLVTGSRLSVSAFGVDSNKELYVCDLVGGIYKFVETPIQ
ncbi:PQQ-dependent sugar dehydrogenase [Croceivirga thetidis]|uniref:PQQ-dependent sugar dehydrogenase n=1 Tax=Croceivirga thetidis TaxID=2721623 RepID=A0ABX1GPQ9_9FLAO|nr:PQQ-dependent sugar dehydrogenase [Croceivirga thetidis]NKI31897.1 PQQ-dependent sugar dehydrogenase [Croceivirga thetidis]